MNKIWRMIVMMVFVFALCAGAVSAQDLVVYPAQGQSPEPSEEVAHGLGRLGDLASRGPAVDFRRRPAPEPGEA